jgi:quinol monooxygenase YgiN
MAIGVIATLKIQDGKGAELEEVFRTLSEQVRAGEPGNQLYRLCKSRSEANTYVVMEIYADQAAIDAHRGAEHFKAAGPRIGACLAGRPDVQYFDAV